MQILPAIDIRAGRCVRLRQGDYSRETVFDEDPLAVARRWAEQGAERLHVVDLDGAKAGRPVNHELAGEISRAAGVPCQLGGGVRDDAALEHLLDEIGLDRVIVGSQALKKPDWFRAAAKRYPGRIALGLDARKTAGVSLVATEGWLDVSQTTAYELARRYAELPLAAVIYTNIANDGMLQGIDEATVTDLIALAGMGLPVIASGGVTTLDDVRRLVEVSRAHPHLSGAIIGRALYEGTLRLPDALALAAEAN